MSGKPIDEAVVEAGLRAAAEASDARLPRYKVVRAIIEAALTAAQQQGQAVAEVVQEADGVNLRFVGPILPAGTKLYTDPPPSAPVGVDAAKHWHDLYRKECQLRQDDAARYGQQIVDLEALAQQPAASYCSDERPCIPCFSDCGPCEDVPAAVDEVAKDLRGLIAEIDPARLPATGEKKLIADQLRETLAKLATQHQEPKS